MLTNKPHTLYNYYLSILLQGEHVRVLSPVKVVRVSSTVSLQLDKMVVHTEYVFTYICSMKTGDTSREINRLYFCFNTNNVID